MRSSSVFTAAALFCAAGCSTAAAVDLYQGSQNDMVAYGEAMGRAIASIPTESALGLGDTDDDNAQDDEDDDDQDEALLDIGDDEDNDDDDDEDNDDDDDEDNEALLDIGDDEDDDNDDDDDDDDDEDEASDDDDDDDDDVSGDLLVSLGRRGRRKAGWNEDRMPEDTGGLSQQERRELLNREVAKVGRGEFRTLINYYMRNYGTGSRELKNAAGIARGGAKETFRYPKELGKKDPWNQIALGVSGGVTDAYDPQPGKAAAEPVPSRFDPTVHIPRDRDGELFDDDGPLAHRRPAVVGESVLPPGTASNGDAEALSDVN